MHLQKVVRFRCGMRNLQWPGNDGMQLMWRWWHSCPHYSKAHHTKVELLLVPQRILLLHHLDGQIPALTKASCKAVRVLSQSLQWLRMTSCQRPFSRHTGRTLATRIAAAVADRHRGKQHVHLVWSMKLLFNFFWKCARGPCAILSISIKLCRDENDMNRYTGR